MLSDSDENEIVHGELGGYGPAGNGEAMRLADGSDRNRILNTNAWEEGAGLEIEGSAGNRVARSDLNGESAISLVRADRTVIVDNELVGFTGGAYLVAADANRIRANEVNGIQISGDRNRVARNNLPWATDWGIKLWRGDANRLRENTITGTGLDGIRVALAAMHSRVYGNLVTGASEDGIDVNARGTLIRDNTATDSDDLGIEAVKGVINGGGNRASGNGNPLQCRNVICK